MTILGGEFMANGRIKVKCVRLVEQFLREEENLLVHLKERGHSTNHSRYKIARMKYALGETSLQPNWKDYFPTKGCFVSR